MSFFKNKVVIGNIQLVGYMYQFLLPVHAPYPYQKFFSYCH